MSIPTSLIVVVLVLAWLVVLVPMVARRREAVPEAEMAGGTFRVLQRSGDNVRRRPVFRRRPDRADDDGAEDPAVQQVSGDQELDEELLDDEYDDYDEDADDLDSDEDERDEYSSDEYDSQDDDDFAAAEPAPTAMTSGGGAGRGTTGSHPYQAEERQTSGSHPYRPATQHQSEQPAYQAEPVPYEDHSPVQDEDAHSVGRVSAPAQHADDMHLRPIPRRAGRGGYDPDAAEVARQFKYSRRRRITVVLLLAVVLFSAAAVVINPVLWAGTAVFGLLLIGYLAYLRRQVQIEASIRERRLARLRRARQIRPEYDVDRRENPVAGGPFPRGRVQASQVPATGYRRGREIVDLDDDDPSFEDLEYYQPLTYRRASGQ